MNSVTLCVMFVLKKCREAENLRTPYILWSTKGYFRRALMESDSPENLKGL